MTNSRTIVVSMLVLAGATCITCGVLDEFMSGNIMGGVGGGSRGEGSKNPFGRIGTLVSGEASKSKPEAEYSEKQGAGTKETSVKAEVSKITIEKGSSSGSKQSSGSKTGGSKENELDKKQEGFLGCKTPADFLKLAMNPIELVSRVVEHFGLHKGKFMEHISKAVSFGVEIALQPALVTLKIVEKIFVPDVCRLKFVCKLANPLSFSKGFLPKLSTKFFEGSAMIKAFSDGLQGCDCDAVYSGCKNGEPKLKHMFETSGSHSSADTSGAFPTAINVSEMGGNILKSFQFKGQQ